MNNPEAIVTLTQEQLKGVIHDSVTETLTRLGMDHSNPFEMQRDFQHLRDWRLSSESIKKKGMVAMIGVALSGVLALLWVGFKVVVKQ